MAKKALFTLIALLLVAGLVELLARGWEAVRPPGQRTVPTTEPRQDTSAFRQKLEALRAKQGNGIPMQADEARRWGLTPGTRLQFGKYDMDLRVNSLGMRGPEVAPRGPREERILALGDSTVFGDMVAERQVFANVAARLLSERLGRPVTAVIGAVPGHDSGQSLKTLIKHGRRVQPTWVVIATLWSDVVYRKGPDMRFDADQQSVLQLRRWLGYLASYRVLRRALGPWLHTRRVRWIASRDDIGPSQDGKHSRVPLGSYINNLRRMASQASALGARPLFLILPAPMDFDTVPPVETVAVYRQAMRHVAGEVEAPVVDGPAYFRKRGAGITGFWDHVHPNHLGHALLGQAVAGAMAGTAAPVKAGPAPPGQPPAPPGPVPPGQPGPLPPGVLGPGMVTRHGKPEDPRASWDPALAVAVGKVASPGKCPDRDSDGFPDAWTCPGMPPEKADCDDGDAGVTPATERFVRPGPFIMGSASEQAGQDERPVHVVQLSGYCLDRAEATRTDFAAFKKRPAPKKGGDLPAERVSFADARAFCRARGKDLATEAQWEKAARGGCELGANPDACDAGDLRPYPWGKEAPTCERANHRLSMGTDIRLCQGRAQAAKLPLNAGPYGHLQLAGNMWEWVADWYHPGVYRRSPGRVDPKGPARGEQRVLRGGGWNTFSTNMRVANRMNAILEGSVTGIRCARSKTRGRPDAVVPVHYGTISGEVFGPDGGTLTGRALYVTAFDVRDMDRGPGGYTPGPGLSPAAQVKLAPSGKAQQTFKLRAPRGTRYVIMSSLDVDAPVQPGGSWAPPTSTGGVGQAEKNPVSLDKDAPGVVIRLGRPTPINRAPGVSPGGPGPGGPGDLDAPTPPIPGDGPVSLPVAGDRWSKPRVIARAAGGIHRPQVAVDSKGGVHVVYYLKRGAAEVVVYRHGPAGKPLGPHVPISQQTARNLGPDLVLGPDGMPWVCYDHARPDFTGDVFLTRKTKRGWTTPQQVSTEKNVETSSSHLAFGPRGALTLVWLSRPPRQPGGQSKVLRRTRSAAGKWGPIKAVYSGGQDAMHAAIMGGPGGLQVLAFDIMPRQDFRQVQVAVTLDGKIQAIGDNSLSTERPNFGFVGGQVIHAAWTTALHHVRVGVSWSVGRVAAGSTTWSAPLRFTRGVRGRHYDPDLAGGRGGEVMVVWAWSAAGKSTLLYSSLKNGKHTPPRSMGQDPGMASLPSISAGPDGRFHVVWNQGERDKEAIYYSVSKKMR